MSERKIEVDGCIRCAFARRYRSEWECAFVMGKIIQRIAVIPEICPLKEGKITFSIKAGSVIKGAQNDE